MRGSVESNTATTCHPLGSKDDLTVPDQFDEYQQPKSRRWSLGRCESISNCRNRLTTRTSSAPILSASRFNLTKSSSTFLRLKQQTARRRKPTTSFTSLGIKPHQRVVVRFCYLAPP